MYFPSFFLTWAHGNGNWSVSTISFNQHLNLLFNYKSAVKQDMLEALNEMDRATSLMPLQKLEKDYQERKISRTDDLIKKAELNNQTNP